MSAERNTHFLATAILATHFAVLVKVWSHKNSSNSLFKFARPASISHQLGPIRQNTCRVVLSFFPECFNHAALFRRIMNNFNTDQMQGSQTMGKSAIWMDGWLFSYSYREVECKERTTSGHCPCCPHFSNATRYDPRSKGVSQICSSLHSGWL